MISNLHLFKNFSDIMQTIPLDCVRDATRTVRSVWDLSPQTVCLVIHISSCCAPRTNVSSLALNIIMRIVIQTPVNDATLPAVPAKVRSYIMCFYATRALKYYLHLLSQLSLLKIILCSRQLTCYTKPCPFMKVEHFSNDTVLVLPKVPLDRLWKSNNCAVKQVHFWTHHTPQ